MKPKFVIILFITLGIQIIIISILLLIKTIIIILVIIIIIIIIIIITIMIVVLIFIIPAQLFSSLIILQGHLHSQWKTCESCQNTPDLMYAHCERSHCKHAPVPTFLQLHWPVVYGNELKLDMCVCVEAPYIQL